MGYSFLPMSAGIVELVARGLAAFTLVRTFQFTGICLASPAAWTAADVLLISATVWAMYSLRQPEAARDASRFRVGG